MGSLVSITKSASPTLNQVTNPRLLRYQMQSVARHMLPENRLKICLRYQREKYGTVDIFKHRQTQKAFYGGLMVCGSVWVCPVCASKISERRRNELKHAYESHQASGGYVTMLTLTFSHSRSDKLQDLITLFSQALKKFQSGKLYAAMRKELGYIGTVRAFEITYGENGWHPHIHLLILHDVEIEGWERDDYETRYYKMWSTACRSVGLETSRAHGLKLDDAAEAGNYITKHGDVKKSWGTDSEMTKANIKKGREGSLTPFDFLRIAVEDGDLNYEPQFREYARTTKELRLRQLYWSPGLKKKFEIEDKTDEQVAEAKEEPADRLGGLDWYHWKYILEHEYRVKLLELVEEHGYDDALKKIGIKKESAAVTANPQSDKA
jgi:hypothetical protein